MRIMWISRLVCHPTSRGFTTRMFQSDEVLKTRLPESSASPGLVGVRSRFAEPGNLGAGQRRTAHPWVCGTGTGVRSLGQVTHVRGAAQVLAWGRPAPVRRPLPLRGRAARVGPNLTGCLRPEAGARPPHPARAWRHARLLGNAARFWREGNDERPGSEPAGSRADLMLATGGRPMRTGTVSLSSFEESGARGRI